MKKGGSVFVFLIGLIGFALFAIPFLIQGILNIGNMTGMCIGLCLLLYAVKMDAIHHLLKTFWRKTMGKVLLSLCAIFLSAVFGLTCATTYAIIKANSVTPPKGATVIVLGCSVYGERPSLMLVERLEAAYTYLTANPEDICILSGGQGPREDITEAEAMYRYLTEKGIDPARLYKEDLSTSTEENLLFSKEIIDSHNFSENVVLITNEFHEYRGALQAKKLGLNPSACGARTAWFLFPTFYVRELYGIVYEWIF